MGPGGSVGVSVDSRGYIVVTSLWFKVSVVGLQEQRQLVSVASSQCHCHGLWS